MPKIAVLDDLEAPAAGRTGGSLGEGLRVGRITEDTTSTPLQSTAGPEAQPFALNVNAPRLPPVADPNSLTVPEDTLLPVRLTGRDIDGTVVSYTVVRVPTGGVLTKANGTPVGDNTVLTPDEAANLVFAPAPNFNGNPGNVEFFVTDNEGNLSPQVPVTILVTPVNDPPVAGTVPQGPDDVPISDPDPTHLPESPDYQLITPEDTPIPGQVRATDVDLDVLTYSKTTDPSNGTVTVNPDGSFVYTPAPGYNGPDQFTVTVDDGNGGTDLSTIFITVTPVDDVETPFAKTVSSPTVPEGTNLDFAVLFSASSTTPLPVTLRLVNGTATAGVDTEPPLVSIDHGATFTPAVFNADGSFSVVLPANFEVDTLVVRVPTVQDGISEGPETISLAVSTGGTAEPASIGIGADGQIDKTLLADPGEATILASAVRTATGTGTITDTPPQVSIADVTVSENAGVAVFTVTLSNPSTSTVTVNYSTRDGTALGDSTGDLTADYGTSTGTVSFAPGQTSQTVSVPITNDAVYEGSENFFVTLSTPTNATILRPEATGTIVDDGSGPPSPPPPASPPDTPPSPPDDDRARLSVNNVTVSEGTAAVFAVGVPLSAYTTLVKLELSTADPLTTEPNDIGTDLVVSYLDSTGATVVLAVGADGNYSVPAGVTALSVSVPTIQDFIYEGPEDFSLTATSPSPSVTGGDTGIGTIIDDGSGPPPPPPPGPPDTPPPPPDDDRGRLTVNNVTVSEGAAAVFAVGVPASEQSTLVSFSLSTTDPLTAEPNDIGATLVVSYVDASGATVVLSADANGAYTVPAGVTGLSVSVPTIQDFIYEGAEDFSLTATSTSPSVTAGATGIGTIVDDGSGPPSPPPPNSPPDTPPTPPDDDRGVLTVNNVTVSEGAAAVFAVGVPASEQSTLVSFSLSTTDPLTAEPNDIGATLVVSYVDASGATVVLSADANGAYTVPAGVTGLSVSVPTIQDIVFEGPETFSLSATSPSPSVTAGATGIGTIVDDGSGPPSPPPPNSPPDTPPTPPDDDRPSVSVGSAQAVEGNQLVFAVGISNPSDTPVTISLSPQFGAGAGAAGAADIGPLQVETSPGVWTDVVGGQITLAAGQTSANVRTLAIDDSLFENTESFTLQGDLVVGGKASSATGIGTIFDNDGAPTFSVNDVTVSEGGIATFTVTRSGDLSQAQSVTANTAITAGNTAEADDFTARSGVVVQFAAGQSTATFTVQTTADEPVKVFEGPETFSVQLSNATNGAQVADGLGIGTIVDDGSGPPSPPPPGSPPGTPPTPPDDDRPSVVVGDATATEGNQLVFSVGLSNAATSAVTITLAPQFAAGSGAASGADIGPLQVETAPGVWTDVVGGQVTLAAGQTAVNVRTLAIDDSLFEGTETFNLKGDATVAGKASTDTGLGTILDNDGPPAFSVNDVTVSEGGIATFTVTRSGDLSQAQSVTANTAITAGNTAEADDFTARSGVVVQFAAGQSTATFTVQTTADEPVKVFEGPETFSVQLSNATNGAQVADGLGIGTIVDDGSGPPSPPPPGSPPGTPPTPPDDDRPSVVVGDATATEGNQLVFAVSVGNASAAPVTISLTPQFSTGAGAAVAADIGPLQVETAPGVWTDVVAGQVTLAAGQTTVNVRTLAIDDSLFEGTETFTLKADATVGGKSSSDTGLGTILDNDAAPAFSVDDVRVSEGGIATFTVTRSGDLSQAQSVTVSTALNPGDTAEVDDFTARSNVVVQFAPGQATATFSVQTTADEPTKVYEGPETFSVQLSNPTNGAVVADGLGLGTILDDGSGPPSPPPPGSPPGTPPTPPDDDRPVVSISVAPAAVAEDGPANLVYTISLDGGRTSAYPTVVNFTVSGTATEGSDYATIVRSVTIPAGQSSATVIVDPTPDNLIEGNETVIATLSSASTNGVTLGLNPSASSATGTIIDNDVLPDGADLSATTREDVTYTVKVSDFGFSDSGGDTFKAVIINSLASNGKLQLNGADVAVGTTIPVATIEAGNLKWVPDLNESGAPYGNFRFTVQDSADQLDPVPNTFTLNVTPVADLPTLSITPKTFGLTENFESVTVGTGGFANVLATSIGTGVWRTDNLDLTPGNSTAVGQVEIGVGNTYGITSPVATNKILELEQDPSNRGNFYTVIANTEAGEVYTLNLDFAARQNNGAVNNSVVYVYWEGQLVQVLDSTSGVLAAVPQLQLLATGANAKLEFISADSNSFGGVIDNISLQLLANTGIEGNRVNLSDISAALVDTDGSESLAVAISGMPAGATLTDGVRSAAVADLASKVDVTGWNLNDLYLVGSAGSYTLKVEATSTEAGTPAVAGDKTATVSADIPVTILADAANLVGSSADDTNLVGTTGNDRMWGLEGNDTLSGGNGNDTLIGGAGNDTLRGEAGNDVLDGGVGNDILVGGAGRDIIQGGQGADVMTGGATAGVSNDTTTDVFRWSLGDGGTAGAPVNDIINDFNAASVANNGDVLDLRDLLVGESATAASLRNYLDFDTTSLPGQTVIRISTTGGFANGNYAAGAEDQRITLTNLNLRTDLGLAANATDDQVINQLIGRNKLVVDGLG